MRAAELIEDHAKESVAQFFIGHQRCVGAHDVFIGAGQRAIDVGDDITQERNALHLTRELGEALRVFQTQALERRPRTIPAGKIKA